MANISTLDSLFTSLWQRYIHINPEAKKIHQLFAKQDNFSNDHIALRTFDHPKTNLNVLARVFLAHGYQAKEQYTFVNKHLIAQHFEHPKHPKVFISAFDITTLSKENQASIQRCITQIPEASTTQDDFVNAGRLWQASYKTYQSLLAESEYAAWLYAFGFVANHFTVNINDLGTMQQDITIVNQTLKDHGYILNDAGGEIKGTPDDLLEQSSTKASLTPVDFTEKTISIPGCYYEFAKRYPNKNGALFQGFIAQSADKIFESTNTT